MKVEVVFALHDRQELVSLSLDEGATVETAISLSGIARRFPGEDLSRCQAGIWGNLVDRDRPLRDGDRVELYRPLSIDPREARRKLAMSGRSMGRPGDKPSKDPD